jgi:hypothetical protein
MRMAWKVTIYSPVRSENPLSNSIAAIRHSLAGWCHRSHRIGLPSRAPPPVYLPPPPIFTWTGIYIGGQIGYAWGSGSNNFNEFDPFTGTAFTTNAGGELQTG